MEITLPQVVVFLQKAHLFIHKNLSLFLFVFHMNAALYLFHIDSFFLPTPPLAPPSLKTLPENRSKMRSHAKKQKNTKRTKKKKKEKIMKVQKS